MTEEKRPENTGNSSLLKKRKKPAICVWSNFPENAILSSKHFSVSKKNGMLACVYLKYSDVDYENNHHSTSENGCKTKKFKISKLNL